MPRKLLALAAALLVAAPAAAQETDEDEGTRLPAKAVPSDNPAENPLPLPPKADDAESLETYLATISAAKPADKTRDAIVDHVEDLMQRIDQVLNRKLAAETLRSAAGLKFSLLDYQLKLGVDGAAEARDEWIGELAGSADPTTARTGAGMLVLRDLQKAVAKSEAEEDAGKLWEAATARTLRLLKMSDGDAFSADVAMQVAEQIEEHSDRKAAAALKDFAAAFRAAPEPRLARAADYLSAKAGKLELPGSEMVITGTTPDGEPFELSSLKGKVVLVDFWATWCGPCVESFPELEKLYEAHRGEGLEIVGVNQDESLRQLKAFLKDTPLPWTQVQNLGEDGGEPHPNAQRYGVNAIPFVVLVGRNGKVVKVNVKPDELADLVEAELAKDEA